MNCIKTLIVIAVTILFVQNITAQNIKTQELRSIKMDKSTTNVQSIPLYSDDYASAFIVFVKKQVPKHIHAEHTEIVVVLEGKGEMFLGHEIFTVRKGDQIIIPAMTAHAVITRSKKPLKVLSIQSPRFEGEDRIILEEIVD